MSTHQRDGVARLNRIYEQYVRPVEEEHAEEYVLVRPDGEMIFDDKIVALLEKTHHLAHQDNCIFSLRFNPDGSMGWPVGKWLLGGRPATSANGTGTGRFWHVRAATEAAWTYQNSPPADLVSLSLREGSLPNPAPASPGVKSQA